MNAYPLSDYTAHLKRAVFSGNTPNDGRRGLQRVYVQCLESLISRPIALAAGPPGGSGGGAATRFISVV